MSGLKAGGAPHQELDPSKGDRLKFAMGSENGPLFKVVIRFKDDFNVPDKVKRDAALRPSASWQEEPDGCVLFYDTVAGLGEISRWVRQFGASAQVLEPPELCNKIKEGARRKLARYEREEGGPKQWMKQNGHS
ncbi:MAG TPA: hypothetical protein DEB05_08205 [Firmicutes bacterium]|jgi:hypothetical protein|nr:hypothetical protein [Bacillota bacterium]HBT16920.1 hypothetical protein [Bacillota bacterium]